MPTIDLLIYTSIQILIRVAHENWTLSHKKLHTLTFVKENLSFSLIYIYILHELQFIIFHL